MMLMLLAKRRLSSPQIHLLLPAFFSSASPNTPTFFVADYLISSFGFSPDKAAKVSKRLPRFSSPEKLDAVCRFLKDQGFSESDVKRLVTSNPGILGSSPEKTLDPNLRALRDVGLSTSAINQIILSGPQALQIQSTVPRIRFWMDFFNHNEAALVAAFERNLGLVGHDIDKVVSPKISLLRSRGFSTHDIQMIVCKVRRFITCRISGMEDLLKRTEELGFQRKSGMFLQGLEAMVYVTRDMLHKKMEFLMSFGWSEEDFHSALRKAPGFVSLTEKNLQEKMDFFTGEAMCDISHIASHPWLLKFSLEKRLRPRNNVLRLLESKGLSANGQNLFSVMRYTDRQFVDKYILPHKEEILRQNLFSVMRYTDRQFVDKYILPHKEEILRLHEAYLAACAGQARTSRW